MVLPRTLPAVHQMVLKLEGLRDWLLVWQLPKCYTDTLRQQKSATVYQHVYASYYGAGQSVYAVAG